MDRNGLKFLNYRNVLTNGNAAVTHFIIATSFGIISVEDEACLPKRGKWEDQNSTWVIRNLTFMHYSCSSLLNHIWKKNPKQEWSSMESSSYENWDEIEMFVGHLVIGNLHLVIDNRLLAIVMGNQLLALGHWHLVIGTWSFVIVDW